MSRLQQLPSFDDYRLNTWRQYTVSSLKQALQEVHEVVPPHARKLDIGLILDSVLYKIVLTSLSIMDQKRRDEYHILLHKYEEASANSQHCGILKDKLETALSDQENEIRAILDAAQNLSPEEAENLAAQLDELQVKVSDEIADIEASQEVHQDNLAAIEESHQNIPDAPPLFAPVLDEATHQVTADGSSIIEELQATPVKLKAVIKDEKKQLEENEILLQAVLDGKKSLKHTVQVERVPIDSNVDSLHGQLMRQIREARKTKTNDITGEGETGARHRRRRGGSVKKAGSRKGRGGSRKKAGSRKRKRTTRRR